MWTELEVFNGIKEAADVLGTAYHRANAGVVGTKLSVSFSDESGVLLGRYLVTKSGTVTPAD